MIRRWFCWVYIGCALALALGADAARAAPGEVAIDAQPFVVLSSEFTSLEDQAGQLTIDDILKPQAQAAFRPVSDRAAGSNFGLTSSAIWLRIKLRVAAGNSPDWLLQHAYPPLNRIELFAPDDRSGYQRQIAGDLQPFRSRAIPHRTHVLPVRLATGGDTVLYMRLTSQGTVVAPVVLWRPTALWRHDHFEYAVLSMYFGLMAGLLLYNLLLFVSIRDAGYLIYVAFVASMMCLQAALTGLGSQFLWPGWTWWNSILPNAGSAASAIFGLLVARHFLFGSVRMPRINRVVLAQLVGWVLTLLAALTLPYAISAWMVTVLVGLGVVTVLTAGVISIRQQFAGARAFFAAWVVLLAGVVAQALHDAGQVPCNLLTLNSLLIGSALEMVLLSFALADRINVARRFKEQAQARIAAERAMVGALSQSQDRLRVELQEREAILDRMLVGIELCVARRHEWVNRRFAQMLGYAPEALIGQSTRAIHLDQPSWERFGRDSRAALAATGSYVCEYAFRRADGGVLWVELSGTCLHPKDPDAGVIWTFLDLTGRPHSESVPAPLAAVEPLPAADPAHPG